MICKHCGKEFVGLFSDICPFCGTDNSESIVDSIFSDPPGKKEKEPLDPYDWENPDNCSDREYMDEDDYDDYDN